MIQGIYFDEDTKQFSVYEDDTQYYSDKSTEREISLLKTKLRALEESKIKALHKYNTGEEKVRTLRTIAGGVAGAGLGALLSRHTVKDKKTGAESKKSRKSAILLGAGLGAIAGKKTAKSRTSDAYLRMKTIDSEIEAVKKRLKDLGA